ncbi:MAG: hypothetical protein PWP31_156 [Clostridia bacterium]|nr:hypothetical protein [Clostridia bacterium]
MTKRVEIDNRGLACPMPVVNTKKALEELDSGIVTCLVDNEIAKENVSKFARNAGYNFRVDSEGENYRIIISKGASLPESSEKDKETTCELGKTYLISTNYFGKGEKELGRLLMQSFLYSLTEQESVPKVLIFINSGVYLTTEGSPVLEHLKSLVAKGTDIISCGTCLDYYKLKDKLVVGRITNMYEIVEQLNDTQNVVTIA